MRTRAALLVTVAVVAGAASGCDESSEGHGSTIPTASARSTAALPMPKPPPAPDRWDELELTCDKVLPAALREKTGVAGWTLNESGGHKGTLSCGFVDPRSPVRQRTFRYDCKGHPAERATGPGLQAMTGAFHSMAKDARDLTGLGRTAMVGTTMGVPELWVLDDKTPCRVTIALGMEKTLPTEELGHAVMDQFHDAVAP